MIIRCQLCNTPLFELRKVGDDAIILLKAKHHGQEHISLINVRELLKLVEKGELIGMTQTFDEIVSSVER